jgi:hypothetical protein
MDYIIYCFYTISKAQHGCTNFNLSFLTCCWVFQSIVAMIPYSLYFTVFFH